MDARDENVEVAAGSSPLMAILAYHKIGPPSGPEETWYYVPEDVFARHLSTLTELGWHAISVEDFLRGLSAPETLPPRAVLLTFDDGCRSVLDYACPLLLEFGFPGVAFVPTDYIGGISDFGTPEPPEPVCSLEELRELDALGVSVQSHGVTHRRLSTLTRDDVQEELVRSKAVLEVGLGKPIVGFAYPFGDPGNPSLVRRDFEETGYRFACLYGGGAFRFPIDHFALPRLTIGPDSDLVSLLQA